jgi:hypothetical protein
MGFLTKATITSIAAYFAYAAYDFHGRDEVEKTIISVAPPPQIFGKSYAGLKGYDGNVINGFAEDKHIIIQWEIDKGNNDPSYKKKLIELGLRDIADEKERKYFFELLPEKYKPKLFPISLHPEEINKTTFGQRYAGHTLMIQTIAIEQDKDMRKMLRMGPPTYQEPK